MARKSNKPNIKFTVGSTFFVVEDKSFLSNSDKLFNAEVIEELKTVVKIKLHLEGSDFTKERTMNKQTLKIARKGTSWGEGEYHVYENREQYTDKIEAQQALVNRKNRLRETFEDLLKNGSLDDIEKALNSLK